MSNKLTGFFSKYILKSIELPPISPEDNPPGGSGGGGNIGDPNQSGPGNSGGPIINEPITLPTNSGLTIYGGYNFTGNSRLITADVPNLGAIGWSNSILSLKYVAFSPHNPLFAFQIFTGNNYTGSRVVLQPGNYPINPLIGGMVNNSIKFGPFAEIPVEPPPVNNGCFTADTKITMFDGSLKNICDVVPGDRVLSYNIPSFTNRENLQQIFSWWTQILQGSHLSGANVIDCVGKQFHYYYDINDGFLKVTVEHPLLVQRGNIWSFKPARDIIIGDRIKSFEGTCLIKSINKVYEDSYYWNLDIDGSNLYFANGLVAHNAISTGGSLYVEKF